MDRDVCIKNHVVGVLASFLACSEIPLRYENMNELAAEITQAVLEGDKIWSQAECENQEMEIMGEL